MGYFKQLLEGLRRFIVANCEAAFEKLCHAFQVMCGHCNCKADGEIVLNQGPHEVIITTEVAPTAVYLSVQPSETPTCIGDIDFVGCVLMPNGFTLYADIKSVSAVVSYIIKSN